MSFKKHILIISVYTLITIVFTWPLAINLNKATPSIIPFYPQYKNMTDEYIAIWITWHLKRVIEEKENFFFLKDLFYPIGANFLVADHSLAESFMVLPILIVSDNPIIAYNFIVILSFILSAYAVFLLIFYFTKNKEASFICGLTFSFSSAKIAHTIASHQAVMSLQWLPLFLLFFIKIFKEDRLSNYIWASVFLLLTTLTSYYLLVFLVLFAIIWVILNIRANKNNLLKLGKFSLCAGLLHIPFIMALIQAVTQGYFPKGIGNFEMSYFYGADLLGFFAPGFFHSFFKNIVSGFYKNLSGNAWEHTTYIGYTVLFLFLFSLYKLRRIKEVRKFGIISFFFFILSLGAVFWIGGRPLIVGHKFIYFPQYLFKFIPILNNIRLPSRFFFMMSLSLTIVCGYGIKFILEKFKTKKIILTSIFSFLILIENLSLPFPLNKDLEIPSVYKEISKEEGEFTILNIPFCVYSGVRTLGFYWTPPQYYQIFHKKNILGGNLGRVPDFVYEYYQRAPFISSIIKFQAKKPLTAENIEFDKKNLDKILRFLNLRYIVIDKNFVNTPTSRYIDFLLKNKAQKKVYPDGYICYRLNNLGSIKFNTIDFSKKTSSLYIVKGLSFYEENPKVAWIKEDSSRIMFLVDEKKNLKIEFEILSLKTQRVKLRVNGKKFYWKLVKGRNQKNILLEKKYINKGINYIDFISEGKNLWGLAKIRVKIIYRLPLLNKKFSTVFRK